jgi:hypothetical protein
MAGVYHNVGCMGEESIGCTYKVAALFAGGDYRPIDLVVWLSKLIRREENHHGNYWYT